MKKICLVMLACLMLLIACAWAEELPTVSFTDVKGEVNSSCVLEIALHCDAPFAQETAVTVHCAQDDSVHTVVFQPGQTEAVLAFTAPDVEKRGETVLTVLGGEGYQAGADAFKCKLYPLPRVQFYKTIHIGYVGKELNVILECKNPAMLLKQHNTVELRDETGRVYGQKEWKNPEKRTNITFPVTQDMLGRHNLEVWYNGVRVTQPDDGYCAVSVHGEKIISTFDTQEPYMCITLDCAYSDDQTIEILDILDKYNVKVTFFMTGHYVNTFTETAREMVKRGHEIGNHSLSHPNLATQCTQVNKRLEQIRTPVDDIWNLLGVRTRLFRPPYGAYDGEVLAMVRAEGMEMAKWTIDSHDWDEAYKTSPERIYRRVTKDVAPGTVILFHIDGFNTPKVLDQVIPYYQNELGLKLVTVSEMCKIVGRELPEVPHADSYMTK